ncbi:MAG: amino acid adenylation domain-containing protein [Phycisphaerales bacterium]
MPPGGSLIQALHASFDRHADRVAIEEWPDGRALTYAQLDQASASLAASLWRQGVRPGSMVPLVMPRSPDYLVAVVAVLRCGAAYAPIDPADPRRRHMLESLGSPVVIGQEAGMLDPSRIDEQGAAPDVTVAPDDAAYVMHTSGTTGQPKGVIVPHRAVIRLVIDADFAHFGPDHRWGVMSAVAFDASTLEIWGALLHGGCCVVQAMPVPSLDDLADYLTKGRVTDAWLTASLFNAMVDEHPGAMAGMGQLLTGGERESMPHVRRMKRACPGVTLIHGYGPTENTTFSLCHTISDEDARQDRIPIGTAIHGSTMRIVEPGASADAPKQPLPEGELLVGGLGLALGYLNDQQRSAQKFVTDAAGERWYRTGDLVRLREDGAVVFIGRVDRQVKIRGHRVEPDGIEHELASCPSVDQGVVAVAGDTAETRRLIAFYVPRADADDATVRAELAERIPPTHMPERFIAVASMPIGTTGKADRNALLAAADKPREPTAGREASPTEARLVELFERRLGVKIGPDDGFRERGGHSLLAMRLSVDIRREMGIALPAAEILRRNTIAEMSRIIPTLAAETVEHTNEADDPIGDIRRRASIEHARDGTAMAMLVHQAWHVDPAHDLDRLDAAWRMLLERHEALRTSVVFTDAGPRLVEHDPHAAAVFHAEHGRLRAPDPSDPRVRAACEASIGAGDPPARLHAWNIDDGSQLLLLVFHHAAIDEWSLQILADELDALLAGRSLSSPAPYGSFVRAEAAMRDDELASDLAQRIATGQPPTTVLPPAGPQAGRNLELRDPELTLANVDARAAGLGVAPAALAAAALGLTLQSMYGQPGRWLLTPFARRPSEELQRVVGCCLDMRPLECTAGSLEEAAGHLHRQMLDAQEDRTLPLEALIDRVRQTAPDRAGDATRFGLTYRYIDDRPRPMGASMATPVEIPQPAARFGLCLHVERRTNELRLWLEASADSFTDDQLVEVGRQIMDLMLRGSASPARSARIERFQAEEDHTASLAERSVLAELWTEFLGSEPRPERDFFQDGGTSLLAMRLAGAIHKRLGRRLMLNQFLRRPTLDGLAASIRDDAEHPYAEFSVAGPDDDHSEAAWFIGIPGSAGRAIDLYRLWHELGKGDAPAPDMLAFDLATIATGESDTFDPARFFSRFTALTHAYAMAGHRNGPITVLGYSLGGLVAIDMAHRLVELGHDVRRVVLLDAYASPYLSRTLWWFLAKANARIRAIGRPGNTYTLAPRSHESGDAHAAEASRATWRGIHRTLADWTPPTLCTETVLVRSRPAWRHVRPVWHAATNGLGPALRGPVDVRVTDVEHLAMLTTGADRIAEEIRDVLGATEPITPATPAHRPSPIVRHPGQP